MESCSFLFPAGPVLVVGKVARDEASRTNKVAIKEFVDLYIMTGSRLNSIILNC